LIVLDLAKNPSDLVVGISHEARIENFILVSLESEGSFDVLVLGEDFPCHLQEGHGETVFVLGQAPPFRRQVLQPLFLGLMGKGAILGSTDCFRGEAGLQVFMMAWQSGHDSSLLGPYGLEPDSDLSREA
jgi:hypothetical protein